MSKSSTIRAINGTVSTFPLVLAIMTISIGAFLTIAWASYTRVPELVRASGQIGPLNDLARIDHFDGGVVEDIFVNPGDLVTRGQVLAVIIQPNLRAEIHAAEQKIATLERDRFRLNTVLNRLQAKSLPQDADPVQIPLHDNTPVAVDSTLGAYILSQDALFRARRKTMQARIERLELAVAAALTVQENASQRLEIADETLRQGQNLANGGHISARALAERQDATQQVRQSVLESQLQVLQAQDRKQEAQGQLIEAESAWQEELISKLYETDAQLSALSVNLAEMQVRAERSQLRAPQDGVIQTITADAVGQVVAPGGTVMDMLASHDQLVAIVKLSPQDIGHVFLGAPVSIRPTTFDFRRFGDISGKVIGIAPTSHTDNTQTTYFRTIVALDETTIGTGALRRDLRAGMEVSADITTSDRTVMAYFLKPAERVLSVSLSER